MEARELASGERFDSLFFGFYLGMPSEDFYSRCWQLNKQGLIREGSSNTTVHYDVQNFAYPAGMDFYPGFHDGHIAEMPLAFKYDAWAPWNRHLTADSLKIEVIDLMEEWFGDGFIEIRNPNKGGSNAFVKVDGNRRISIYNQLDEAVKVDIVDLVVKYQLDSLAKAQTL